MKRLDGILGHVILSSGAFTQKEEKVEDHGQLPQFLPRLTWPNKDEAERSEMHSAPLDMTDIHSSSETPRGPYSTLEPMPPYQVENSVYDNCQWLNHLVVVHELFHRGLIRDSGINSKEMLALLRIVSYGMHNSMTYFHPWVVEATDPSTVSHEHINRYLEGWDDTFGMMLRSGSFGNDLTNIADCKQRIWTRRWIVVPMIYGTSQWGMTIFDRKQGQLYIFDCGEEQARGERIKACTEFWMQFWNRFHLPNTFTYFVPPVSPQPSNKDSGLLCIIWLMNTLRDQVGPVMASDDERVQTKNYIICRSHSLPDRFVSSLHLRDWAPFRRRNMRTPLASVRRIIKVLLCNELGLRNNEALIREYTSGQRGRCPSAWARLENLKANLRKNGGTITSENFWAGHGGPQFVTPKGRRVRRYDPSRPRRHSKPSRAHIETIDIKPSALVGRSAQAMNWPSKGVIYTPDFPVYRPPHAEDLAVVDMAIASWRNSPLPTSPAFVHFIAKVQNRAAPLDFQVKNVLNLSVEGIKHEWLDNKLQNLDFTLAARMGDDLPISQPFSFVHSTLPST